MKTAIVILCICVAYIVALNNGLARTPPMGWNSWNHFGCNTDCTTYPNTCISENLFKQMADAMVSSGMAAAGYEYINMDDCWMLGKRNAQGRLVADPARFTNGTLQTLAEYIHSKGLKFGTYIDCGTMTCGGYAGSEGYELIDSQTFAEWGVDYIKIDGCYFPVVDMQEKYTNWSKLLNESGRPMVFSCSWPAYADLNNITIPWDVVEEICNLWREYNDIRDNWNEWTNILDYQVSKGLAPYAGPGHWNDPDMLEVGNGNQTVSEYTSLMSMWAIIAAPLIAGNDLRNMTPQTLALLTAPEVIAIDQDNLGLEGTRLSSNNGLEVWSRTLYNGTAVGLFNRTPNSAQITVTWKMININGSADVRDAWARKDLGTYNTGYTTTVASHDTILLRVTPSSSSLN
jgi:hypothetical protein